MYARSLASIPLSLISAVEDHVNMPLLWVLLSWLLGLSIYRRAGTISIYVRLLI